MASRELKVNIVGDPSSLNKALGSATKSSDRFGKTLKTVGKIAAVGVGAAFAGLAATLKVGFDELADGQKVAAQTAAVLKSTGESANVTAKHVDSLSSSLSQMSGVDDEVIGAGENMLLTFTNIRNEVGKGNDVFDQSTAILLDMSTALGTDMSKSAIQLGKALNDPIKGVSALSRVGVTFTEDQKKLIKGMVESGNVMGAQKLILAELNKEFGGSAKAAGDTFPGQLNKLKNSFSEMAGSLAQTLLPALMGLVSFINEHMPQIQAVVQAAIDGMKAAFEAIGTAIDKVETSFGFIEKHQTIFTALAGAVAGAAIAYTVLSVSIATATVAMAAFDSAAAANPLGLIVIGATALIATLAALYVTNTKVHNAFNNFYEDIRRIAVPTLAAIRQGWQQFGGAITAIVVALVKTITIPFQNAYDIIVGTFRAFRAAFTGDWKALGQALLQIVDALGGNLVKAVLAQAKAVLTAAMAIGRALMDGVKAGIESALQSVLDKITSVGSAIIGALKTATRTHSPSEETIYIGKMLSEGLGVGFGLGMVKVRDELGTKIQSAIDHMIAAVQAKQGAFGSAFDALVSSALSAFDTLSERMMTKTEKLIAKQDAARAAKALQDALSQANQGVDTAHAALASATTPEEAQAALAQLEDALKAQADAEFAIRRAADEKKAAQERAALDNRRGLQRKHFEDQLADLQTALLNQEITVDQFNKRLTNLFKKFHVPLGAEAKGMGLALAEGLNESLGSVKSAAREMAETIAKELKKLQITVSVVLAKDDRGGNPTHLASGGTFRRGQRLLVGERGPELVTFGSAGTVTPNNALGTGSGGINVSFNGPVYGSPRDIAIMVRNELSRMGGWNGGGMLGNAV